MFDTRCIPLFMTVAAVAAAMVTLSGGRGGDGDVDALPLHPLAVVVVAVVTVEAIVEFAAVASGTFVAVEFSEVDTLSLNEACAVSNAFEAASFLGQPAFKRRENSSLKSS